MGTGSFPGVKRPGRGADHPPPSKCRGQEKSRAIPLLPPWAFVACYGSTPVVVCNNWYYHLLRLTGGACVNGHMWHYDILLFRGKNSSISYRHKQSSTWSAVLDTIKRMLIPTNNTYVLPFFISGLIILSYCLVLKGYRNTSMAQLPIVTYQVSQNKSPTTTTATVYSSKIMCVQWVGETQTFQL